MAFASRDHIPARGEVGFDPGGDFAGVRVTVALARGLEGDDVSLKKPRKTDSIRRLTKDCRICGGPIDALGECEWCDGSCSGDSPASEEDAISHSTDDWDVERLFLVHQGDTDAIIFRKIDFLNGLLLDTVTDRKKSLKNKLREIAEIVKMWPPGWESLPSALQVSPADGLLAPFLRGGFDESMGYPRGYRPTPQDIAKRAGHSAAVRLIIDAHGYNCDRFASANPEFFEDLVASALERGTEAEADTKSAAAAAAVRIGPASKGANRSAAAAAAAVRIDSTSKGASRSAVAAAGGPVSTRAIAADLRPSPICGGDEAHEDGEMAVGEEAQSIIAPGTPTGPRRGTRATKAAAATAAVMTDSTSKGASLSAAPAAGGSVPTGAVAGNRLTSSFCAGGGSNAIGAGETAAAGGAAKVAQPAAGSASTGGPRALTKSQLKRQRKKQAQQARLQATRTADADTALELSEGSEGCEASLTGSHAVGPPPGAGPLPHASAGARVKREKAVKVKDKTLDREGASELTGIPPA
jgi:hypothetical protein